MEVVHIPDNEQPTGRAKRAYANVNTESRLVDVDVMKVLLSRFPKIGAYKHMAPATTKYFRLYIKDEDKEKT